MADLRFNREEMLSAADSMARIAENLQTMNTALQGAVSALREDGWRTGAGEAFAARYNQDWAGSFQGQLDAIRSLSQELRVAAQEYAAVEEEAESLRLEEGD